MSGHVTDQFMVACGMDGDVRLCCSLCAWSTGWDTPCMGDLWDEAIGHIRDMHPREDPA